MKKRLAFLICLFTIVHYSQAQYATTGTGSLKNEIWWLNWAGFTVANGASRSFTTDDGLTINVTFSNVSPAIPVPDVMNTWNGAVLHLLYDFTDPSIQPALHSKNTISTVQFTLNITATRNGVPASFTFITADAEGSLPSEVTTLTTNGANWQSIDFFRNSSQTSNPLAGCNTQTVRITDTYGGASQTGQNPVVCTSTTTGALTVGVDLSRTALGGMAVAFGIMAPIDRGDLPASYGQTMHQVVYSIVNSCNYNPPFPAPVLSDALHLGAVKGDADPYQTTDDNAVGVDEEAITSFPYYNNGGAYSITVPLQNTTGADAYLSGWFDYNRNGVFENNEKVTVTVPGSTPATLSWTGLPAYLPVGNTNGYGFRFRISSSLQAVQSPTGLAPDGEVEDYLVPDSVLCAPLTLATIPDTSVCAGQSVQLHTTGNAVQYSWNTSTYLDNAGIASPVATPANTIQYIVTGSTPQACGVKDSVTITVTPPPALTVSGDVSICPGSSTQLSASITGTATYSWLPATGLNNAAIGNPVASPADTTSYVVKATDGNGCSATDSIKVSVLPPPVFAVTPAQPAVCKADTIVLTASGGNTYTWLLSDGSIAGTLPSLTVQPTASQVYQVNIEDACGTAQTLSVPVTVIDLPQPVITKSNDIDCSNGQAVLHVTGGAHYVWDALPGISNLTSANPVVTPIASTTYYVTATNSQGCSIKDSISVEVDLTKAISTFPVPNAFTPNNDGKNDCFGLANWRWSRVTNLQFEVFNRWGQRVFATTNPTDCWDGRFKGVLQPSGAYVYLIKATTICGTAFRKGTVMLIY